MIQFLLPAVTRLARRRKFSFLKKTSRIHHHQQQFLQQLLREHQDTQFGQAHHFHRIDSIEAYQAQVPIRTYAEHEPYILRMAEGEANVLVRDRPIYFNITSGSTGKRKLIPVTRSSRRCVRRASNAATGFLADAALRAGRPLGKLLFPASVNAMGQTKSGVEFAPVSTSDLKLSNGLARTIMSSPYAAHQVKDLKSRIYICLLFALADPQLRVIAETFPVTLLRLCQYLETRAESLIADLRTGTLADDLVLDPEQRQLLERKLAPHPARAEQLADLQKRHGSLTPQTVWPQLSFLITARGGTSDFYFQRFPKYFGDVPVFGGVYSSAEATFGVHRDFNTDGVMLALESGFFEFVPSDQWDEPQPQTRLPWQLEVGQPYRIIVTNYNGFYRYDIGDVVEIEGFHHQTPIFVFRNRYRGFITSVGEKTTEYHVTQVMNALQQKYDLPLLNFCITLSDDIPPRYWVNVELLNQYQMPDPQKFLADFDRLLGEVHSVYELKRRDQVDPPCLRVLAPGSFQRWQQQLVQQGIAETQIKLPKISNDRALFTQTSTILEYRWD
ncbi:GH3 auxin-responsive promoter family protein [Lyngbya confervoides]|uniref:GH3 auxin-responsive promoter family protein n=1 Tax=Lyngbya confervoides BDU141951 TaxID=1574623 RepID=A0ABD4T2W3_9CYAN|nr:GH3 auxin-responsive promoter family protein [Lyngbya confervoides]MCM1982934.1 GH3 auxin-responsive promoter family protein [Lyngbya confervoides BDU141951]